MTCTVGAEKVRWDRPPKLVHVMQSIRNHWKIQFNASFIFFKARTLTVLEAGLALKTQGSLVKGLMPFFAAEAAFFFNFMLSMPANLKLPFFLISAHATAMRASTTPFACFGFKPFDSATEAKTWVCVITPDDFFMAAAFMAFIAFIAGAMVVGGSCFLTMGLELYSFVCCAWSWLELCTHNTQNDTLLE